MCCARAVSKFRPSLNVGDYHVGGGKVAKFYPSFVGRSVPMLKDCLQTEVALHPVVSRFCFWPIACGGFGGWWFWGWVL